MPGLRKALREAMEARQGDNLLRLAVLRRRCEETPLILTPAVPETVQKVPGFWGLPIGGGPDVARILATSLERGYIVLPTGRSARKRLLESAYHDVCYQRALPKIIVRVRSSGYGFAEWELPDAWGAARELEGSLWPNLRAIFDTIELDRDLSRRFGSHLGRTYCTGGTSYGIAFFPPEFSGELVMSLLLHVAECREKVGPLPEVQRRRR